jgi:hypothetical protein
MRAIRDRLNDAITNELFRQLPQAHPMDTGYAIQLEGDVVRGDVVIDVDLIVDKVLDALAHD